MTDFNQLTPAEAERLALLSEELGETQQAIGKILRNGYESQHPDGGPTNRKSLEREIADVLAATRLLYLAEDIDYMTIHDLCEAKLKRVGKYMHHQEN